MAPAIHINAAYRQVYVFDELVNPPYPENITDADLERRVKAVRNLLAIYTAAEREVVLEIEVSQSRPRSRVATWQHIVEAPLAVPSGRIVVASPESYLPEATRVTIPAGSYRVRIAGYGFGDAEGEGYLLTMWPAEDESVSVVKSAGAYAI